MALNQVYVRDIRTNVESFVNPRLLKHPEYRDFLVEVPFDKDCNCPEGLQKDEKSPEPEKPPVQDQTNGETPKDPAPVSKKKVTD